MLVGSGFPSTASALFFQGTVQDGGGLGVALADGLRCVNGSLVRLGIHPSVGGSSSYPQGADLAISLKGLIPPAGGTYHYQTWYRDPVSFCNPETYNLSNGLSVIWAP